MTETTGYLYSLLSMGRIYREERKSIVYNQRAYSEGHGYYSASQEK